MFQDAEFIKSANGKGDFVPDRGREVAIAGRSNAGKSSAINTIVGRKGLARISKTPGRTRLVNFFSLGDKARLVDLPGYGFARVPDPTRRHWHVLMGDYFAGRESLRGVLLIVDSRRGIQDSDRQLIEWVSLHAPTCHVLLTKADKLKRREANQALFDARADLDSHYGGLATVQLFSAHTRDGVDEARTVLSRWLFDH